MIKSVAMDFVKDQNPKPIYLADSLVGLSVWDHLPYPPRGPRHILALGGGFRRSRLVEPVLG